MEEAKPEAAAEECQAPEAGVQDASTAADGDNGPSNSVPDEEDAGTEEPSRKKGKLTQEEYDARRKHNNRKRREKFKDGKKARRWVQNEGAAATFSVHASILGSPWGMP